MVLLESWLAGKLAKLLKERLVKKRGKEVEKKSDRELLEEAARREPERPEVDEEKERLQRKLQFANELNNHVRKFQYEYLLGIWKKPFPLFHAGTLRKDGYSSHHFYTSGIPPEKVDEVTKGLPEVVRYYIKLHTEATKDLDKILHVLHWELLDDYFRRHGDIHTIIHDLRWWLRLPKQLTSFPPDRVRFPFPYVFGILALTRLHAAADPNYAPFEALKYLLSEMYHGMMELDRVVDPAFRDPEKVIEAHRFLREKGLLNDRFEWNPSAILHGYHDIYEFDNALVGTVGAFQRTIHYRQLPEEERGKIEAFRKKYKEIDPLKVLGKFNVDYSVGEDKPDPEEMDKKMKLREEYVRKTLDREKWNEFLRNLEEAFRQAGLGDIVDKDPEELFKEYLDKALQRMSEEEKKRLQERLRTGRLILSPLLGEHSAPVHVALGVERIVRPLFRSGGKGMMDGYLDYFVEATHPRRLHGTALAGLYQTVLDRWERDLRAGREPLHPWGVVEEKLRRVLGDDWRRRLEELGPREAVELASELGVPVHDPVELRRLVRWAEALWGRHAKGERVNFDHHQVVEEVNKVAKLLHSVRSDVEPPRSAVERGREDIVRRLVVEHGDIAREVLEPLERYMEGHVEDSSAYSRLALDVLRDVMPEAVRELGRRLDEGRRIEEASIMAYEKVRKRIDERMVEPRSHSWLKDVFVRLLARAPLVAARRVLDQLSMFAEYTGEQGEVEKVRAGVVGALRSLYGTPKMVPRYGTRVLETFETVRRMPGMAARDFLLDERLGLMGDKAAREAFHHQLAGEIEQHAILHVEDPRERERALDRASKAAERHTVLRPRR